VLFRSQTSSFVYRYYYGSTHWITDASINDNKIWYKVLNERGKALYVNATHLHLFEPEELQPISLDVPIESKRIEIYLKKQVLRAYEENKLVLETRVSTGAEYSDGNFVTDRGQFITNRKRPSRHMVYQAASIANSYDLPGVPWVSYLTSTGVSIHGTYWHNNFGHPMSHGCINMKTPDAQALYNWAPMGTPVSIYGVTPNS
jgi:lipoprotein-anchoring transpeptidase ErfK/SrfK